MKLRIASLAFLIGSLGTALTGLALLPTLARLTRAVAWAAADDRADRKLVDALHAVLPGQVGLVLLLAFTLVTLSALTYALLEWVVGRPLRTVETQLERMEGLNLDLPGEGGGGPLLSRIQASLRRTTEALRSEKGVTAQQLQSLREANQRLQKAQIELVASERLATVGRLAAGVAHEVGNPLAGILGYLSLARARADDASVQEFLGHIDAEVHRIDGIVRSLLDLGRPPALESRVIDVGLIVEGSVRLLKANAEMAGLDVRVQAPGGLMARGEPGALSQVLINLLLNAGQAMAGKGQLDVSAHVTEGKIEVLVADGGPGLSPDTLAHLFEPFFTTKPPGKGTGLGLAISRHLVTSMGGVLTAENRPSGGALFRVRLPAP